MTTTEAARCLPYCSEPPTYEVRYAEPATATARITLTPCTEHLDEALEAGQGLGFTVELLPMIPEPPTAALPAIALAALALSDLLAEAHGGGLPMPFAVGVDNFSEPVHKLQVETYNDLIEWSVYLDAPIGLVQHGEVHGTIIKPATEGDYSVRVVAVLAPEDVPVPFIISGGAA